MNESDWKCRTDLLLGSENLEKLADAKVLIAGVGGVGGYALEQLARSGVGNITIIDSDEVQASNINRQIIALQNNVGKSKVDLAEERAKAINPLATIHKHKIFINKENIYDILANNYDYVIDAIDTLTPKVELLEACVKTDTRVISSMGSGARLDPSLIEITDIAKSHHCRLAYMVRKYLHRKDIRSGIKVVFSSEQVPEHAIIETDGSNNKRTIVGTLSYMPAIFGCSCASVVIRDIIST